MLLKKTGKINIFNVLILLLITGVLFSCSYSSAIEYNYIDGKIDYSGNVLIEKSDSMFIISPKKSEIETGLIFYPGAKVDCEAYLPVLSKCAENGIQCFLVKMPFDMAFNKINAADRIIGNPQYSYIQDWYIMGHSLGGAMAAIYAEKNHEKLKGTVFLAAYSVKDISSCGLKVLSIYGSKDGVLKRNNYEKNKNNLPEDFLEVIIEGGNHAGFGCYGDQKGDNPADISQEEQQQQTVAAIVSFISCE